MWEIEVDNIKCGGCANSIRQQLGAVPSIKAVDVDVAQGKVALELVEDSAAIREQILAQLLKMGYPQAGSVRGLSAAGAKAKSFVSCAVGKLSDDNTEK
ncbi:heavy-metal-associated domain-containing protein [Thiomicrorhabdus cannonii]|uniref:heavy-metal-associated domain-containing protein n=1 Tax=Thiomicrorhabdus cannonii TaxID=2748011 RepID=UPI0015BD105A|nr:heavy metal-associated domain-containing protein [Thiomicrorhabdus cannonii]